MNKVAAKRKAGFDALVTSWEKKWPKSKALALDLKSSFSDLRFASGNRVFLPFNRLLDASLDPATLVTSSDGVDLIDVDGQRLMDISGSYGVNVAGVERYKKFVRGAMEQVLQSRRAHIFCLECLRLNRTHPSLRACHLLLQVGDLGLVLGPVHPLLAENITILKRISRKQEVRAPITVGLINRCAGVRRARTEVRKAYVLWFSCQTGIISHVWHRGCHGSDAALPVQHSQAPYCRVRRELPRLVGRGAAVGWQRALCLRCANAERHGPMGPQGYPGVHKCI